MADAHCFGASTSIRRQDPPARWSTRWLSVTLASLTSLSATVRWYRPPRNHPVSFSRSAYSRIRDQISHRSFKLKEEMRSGMSRIERSTGRGARTEQRANGGLLPHDRDVPTRGPPLCPQPGEVVHPVDSSSKTRRSGLLSPALQSKPIPADTEIIRGVRWDGPASVSATSRIHRGRGTRGRDDQKSGHGKRDRSPTNPSAPGRRRPTECGTSARSGPG